ncbi:pirin [Ectothiorhodospira haloalkaliphila]|uniref:Pirin n=1 Tax=Ectothiorhodospira haloalkaliphila TaxID=421628 RepID=W8KK42_9GAMM|nr:pirin family protein [Ectothiorhodospira haloalkaliphila]AHK79528.1 pirin [Ectothiorhodospira haloalkaliphila]
MITIRPAEERGHTHIDWLDSRHSFSFGDYYDPEQMGVSALRVINDDRVAPGAGFPPHPHRDMEIITYMLEGAIEHRDNTGGHCVLRTGEVQVMSAGRGIVHSEVNASSEEPLHLLQIWILPHTKRVAPGYAQRAFPTSPGLCLLVSPDGDQDSLTIHQDARLFRATLESAPITYEPDRHRNQYIHVARGSLTVNGEILNEGDAAVIQDELAIVLESEDAEALLFDLP